MKHIFYGKYLISQTFQVITYMIPIGLECMGHTCYLGKIKSKIAGDLYNARHLLDRSPDQNKIYTLYHDIQQPYVCHAYPTTLPSHIIEPVLPRESKVERRRYLEDPKFFSIFITFKIKMD